GEAASAAKPSDAEAAAAAREREAEAEAQAKAQTAAEAAKAPPAERLPTPNWFWLVLAIGIAAIVVIYLLWTWERLEIFKFLLTSFFPLAVLILMVLGSIVFGFATPTEAAAVGALGGLVLAAIYRAIERWRTTPQKAKAIGTTLVELGG